MISLPESQSSCHNYLLAGQLSDVPMGRQIVFGFAAEVGWDLASALTAYGFGDKNLGVNLAPMTEFQTSPQSAKTNQQGTMKQGRSHRIH